MEGFEDEGPAARRSRGSLARRVKGFVDSMSWATGLKPRHLVLSCLAIILALLGMAAACLLLLAARAGGPGSGAPYQDGYYERAVSPGPPGRPGARRGPGQGGRAVPASSFWSSLPFFRRTSAETTELAGPSRTPFSNDPSQDELDVSQAGADGGAAPDDGSAPAAGGRQAEPLAGRRPGQDRLRPMDRWGFTGGAAGGGGGGGGFGPQGQADAGAAQPGQAPASLSGQPRGASRAPGERPPTRASRDLPGIPAVDGAPARADDPGPFGKAAPKAASVGTPDSMIHMDASQATPLPEGVGPHKGEQDALLEQHGTGSSGGTTGGNFMRQRQ